MIVVTDFLSIFLSISFQSILFKIEKKTISMIISHSISSILSVHELINWVYAYIELLYT